MSSLNTFDLISAIEYHDNSTSLISSDPLYIFPCNAAISSSDEQISIYPGQVKELSFITVGQRNGTAPTTVLVYSNVGNVAVGVLRTQKYCSSYVIPYW